MKGFPSIDFETGRTDMLAKFTIAALAGSALLAGIAFAQTPTAITDRAAPAATSDTSSFKGDWRASKMVGLSVYNEKNESVGSINDLLTDKSGNIKAVVIGVGGFLGVGEHLVAVAFDKVKFTDEPIVYAAAANDPNAGTAKDPNAGMAKTMPPTTPATTTGAATGATTPAIKPNPWYPDHAVFNATKDELKAMSEFKYSTD
jgi:sporulation protein YlmC with PRC-barrel domain